MSLFVFFIFASFLGGVPSFHFTFIPTMVTIMSIMLAYFLVFIFKMIVGISALWITDYSGLQQLVTVIILIFAGFVIPLPFLPSGIRQIAFMLPFAYMIYFPVTVLQGVSSVANSIQGIGMQIVWLFILTGTFSFLWQRGIRKFTGVGQ